MSNLMPGRAESRGGSADRPAVFPGFSNIPRAHHSHNNTIDTILTFWRAGLHRVTVLY